MSDRGPSFEINKLLGVHKINTTAYHPQTIGLTERFDRSLTGILAKKVAHSGKDWDTHLPFVLFAYRASKQESVKESPYYLLYGRDPRLPTVLDMDSKSGKEYIQRRKFNGNETWQLARNNIKKAQRCQKNYYDQKSKPPNKVGDSVGIHACCKSL